MHCVSMYSLRAPIYLIYEHKGITKYYTQQEHTSGCVWTGYECLSLSNVAETLNSSVSMLWNWWMLIRLPRIKKKPKKTKTFSVRTFGRSLQCQDGRNLRFDCNMTNSFFFFFLALLTLREIKEGPVSKRLVRNMKLNYKRIILQILSKQSWETCRRILHNMPVKVKKNLKKDEIIIQHCEETNVYLIIRGTTITHKKHLYVYGMSVSGAAVLLAF